MQEIAIRVLRLGAKAIESAPPSADARRMRVSLYQLRGKIDGSVRSRVGSRRVATRHVRKHCRVGNRADRYMLVILGLIQIALSGCQIVEAKGGAFLEAHESPHDVVWNLLSLAPAGRDRDVDLPDAGAGSGHRDKLHGGHSTGRITGKRAQHIGVGVSIVSKPKAQRVARRVDRVFVEPTAQSNGEAFRQPGPVVERHGAKTCYRERVDQRRRPFSYAKREVGYQGAHAARGRIDSHARKAVVTVKNDQAQSIPRELGSIDAPPRADKAEYAPRPARRARNNGVLEVVVTERAVASEPHPAHFCIAWPTPRRLCEQWSRGRGGTRSGRECESEVEFGERAPGADYFTSR